MFKRFILASSLKRIEKRFSMAQLPELSYTPTYNIKPGNITLAIAQGQNHQFKQFKFGQLLQNKIQSFIRAEGNKNLDDDPEYSGSKAIFLMPEYKKLIRFNRCYIPADAFIVRKAPDNYYIVYLQNKNRPFAFAGLYSRDAEGEHSFLIITVPANPLLTHLGQKRMPVILQSNDEHTWVKAETPLSGILQAITQYPANLMNAYPVAVPLDAVNNASLVQPTGNPIYQEQKEFMQSTRKHKKVYSSSISFSDRLKL